MGRKNRMSGKKSMAVPFTSKGKGKSRGIRLGRLVYALPVVVLGGLVFAGMKVSGHFSESSSFRLAALEVQGLHLLKGGDILAASGLQVGDNIFEVDLEKVGRRLESLPWVKQALVVRKPPDRLTVSIVERRRLAWIELEKIYGIDSEGVLLPGRREEESYRDLDLPVFRGIRGQDSLDLGETVADSVVAQILEWWQKASAIDADFCLNVSEIQPLGDNSIRLRLVGDGLEVRLPVDRVRERLGILKKLMNRVYRECPEPAYIDLRYAGQVVVGSKSAERRT